MKYVPVNINVHDNTCFVYAFESIPEITCVM